MLLLVSATSTSTATGFKVGRAVRFRRDDIDKLTEETKISITDQYLVPIADIETEAGCRLSPAGVELDGEVRADTRLHDLRHHYASSLISAGCSIVAVQRALEHAKPSVTLDLYGHLMPSDGDRIRGAIDVAWNAEDGLRSRTR